MVSNLVLIHCGSHPLGDAIKRTEQKFRLLIQRNAQF